MLFNLFISSLYVLYFIILFSLDNDVLETSKRRAMFYNILSQIFFLKCITKPLLRLKETLLIILSPSLLHALQVNGQPWTQNCFSWVTHIDWNITVAGGRRHCNTVTAEFQSNRCGIYFPSTTWTGVNHSQSRVALIKWANAEYFEVSS